MSGGRCNLGRDWIQELIAVNRVVITYLAAIKLIKCPGIVAISCSDSVATWSHVSFSVLLLPFLIFLRIYLFLIDIAVTLLQPSKQSKQGTHGVSFSGTPPRKHLPPLFWPAQSSRGRGRPSCLTVLDHVNICVIYIYICVIWCCEMRVINCYHVLSFYVFS